MHRTEPLCWFPYIGWLTLVLRETAYECNFSIFADAVARFVVLSFSAQAVAAAKEIVIGSVVPLSGPLATLGKPLAEGASACFDMVNSNGGINGYQIRFETRDDLFDPKATVTKTQEIIAAHNSIAMINSPGSLQNISLVQSGVLQRANIALVGPRDGSAALREMKSPIDSAVK